MRLAVIGSGPAAAATCLGLIDRLDSSKNKIIVFDIGRKLGKMSVEMSGPPSNWNKGTYRDLHVDLKNNGSGWVPEKSFHGDYPDKYPGYANILRSDNFGGLSKFWGASFLPFHESDFENWPFSYHDLFPYYQAILREVNITGAHDQLDRYFPGGMINDQPIQVPNVIRKLENAVNAGHSGFIAGSPRLSLTNSGLRGCTYCGHCFYGCYNQSIYSADQTIERLAALGLIKYIPGKQLMRFHPSFDRTVRLTFRDTSTGVEESLPFDRVYIGAGCIETTRIVANSLGLQGVALPILENPVYQLPIVYRGKLGDSDFDRMISLNNLLIGMLPMNGIEKYIHAQVYLLNLYLWNHALVKAMGTAGLKLGRLFQSTLGKRIYMMLVYLDGKYTSNSTVRFDGSSQKFDFEFDHDAEMQSKLFSRGLSRQLQGTGFHVLKSFLSKLTPGGSYHYAGTLPMEGQFTKKSGRVNEGVYLVDSSTFPSLPAQNHSFTIMANAYRIAYESVE